MRSKSRKASEKFRTSERGFPVANLDRNNSRTAWSILAIDISFFSKFKALLYGSNLCYLCSSPLGFILRVLDILLSKLKVGAPQKTHMDGTFPTVTLNVFIDF